MSNLVCVAWQWIKNLVCFAWDFVTVPVCLLFSTAVAVVNFFTGGYLSKLINWVIGAKAAPNLETPFEVKQEVNREGANGNPYDRLNWFDSFIAWFTTSVGKENGISGWTRYSLDTCATGKVVQAVWNSDGLYTVDIEMSREDDELVARLPGREFEDGIQKTRWIRAEIEIYKVGLNTTLPVTNQEVTICGPLFWDADGFLEIHPQGAADIHIFGKA